MVDSIQPLHFSPNVEITAVVEKKRLVLNVPNPGTDPCVMVDFGDNNLPDAFGELEHCKDLIEMTKFKHVDGNSYIIGVPLFKGNPSL